MGSDLERLPPAKRALLEQRLTGGGTDPATAAIPARPEGSPAPASYGQRQLWFLAQLAGSPAVNNEAVTIRCPESMEVPSLERAFNEVLRRHQAWRTVLRGQGDDLVQVVVPHEDRPLPRLDLRHLDPPDQVREAHRIAVEDARRPFDDVPPWRAVLIRLEDGYRLQLTLGHAIVDSFSLRRVLLPELVSLHDAYCSAHEPTLGELPIQYADYAAWQRRRAEEPEVRAQLEYWRERLRELPELELPTDRPRPSTDSFRGSFEPLALDAGLTAKLRELGRVEGATLFMTTLAGFLCLLHRLTGQDDLAVGTVGSGRSRPELEGLLGYFLNPLVLRGDLSGAPTFRDVLGRVREMVLAALSHDEVPFEDVVRAVRPERRSGANPLFQVAFSLEPLAPEPEGWALIQDVDTGTSLFDLFVELEERRDGILGRLIYSADLFDAENVRELASDLRSMLEALALEPDLPVGQLALPRRRAVPPIRGPLEAAPAGSITRRFEEIAARWPDRVAVSFGSQELTYGALDARADNLARRLREAGVAPEDLVGIMVERSTEMAVGLLGILKAHGAYVPLNPRDPDHRIRVLAADAACRVVVTTRQDRDRLPPNVRGVFVDDLGERVDPEPETGPVGRPPGPRSLAYVLYTSGSTGSPKGVMVEHRSVLGLVCPATFAELGPDQVVLQMAPLGFDASTLEIWGPLLNGGRLVVAPRGLLSAREIGDVVERRGVDTLWLTAGLFSQVVDAGMPGLGGVRQLLTGGEVVSAAHCRRALELMPDLRLINGYGPTEATTFCCCHTVTQDDLEEDRVPIGRPVGNATVQIMDAHGHPAPVGAPGELWVGGAGVARGYLGAPELTGDRFPADPVAGPEERRYRTGDVVRLRADGALEFLGRRDRQIKIRGFRIEPAEVEAVLREHPQVADAVVDAPELTAQGKRLVAYVVSSGPPPDLISFVAARLPAHMVPQTYVGLDALPLDANGKIDRPALPPFPVPAVEVSNRGPRTDLERGVGELWAELLQRDSVPLDEDFFHLGGHSLLAVRMIAEVERRFGCRLPLEVVFSIGSTARRLSGLIQRTHRLAAVEPSDLVVPLRPRGARPPLFLAVPDRGGLAAMRQLLPHIDPAQPVIALLAPTGDRGLFDRRAGVVGLAAPLVDQVRAIQSLGPYRLAGYGLGGLLAYEIAVRLSEEGEEVPLLALIETAAPGPAGDGGGGIGNRIRRLGLPGPPRQRHGEGFDQEGAEALAATYRPQGLELPLTVIGSRPLRRWTGEASLGWSRVHRGPVDARPVGGDHRTMLEEPRIEELAAVVTARIRATT